MSSIAQDARFALRALRRQPAFTITAVVTLALAIGANAAVFGFLDAVFLRPVPARDPATLISIFRTFSDTGDLSAGAGLLPASYLNVLDFAERTQTLSGLAAEAQSRVSLAGSGDPEQVSAAFVTAGYFDVLGLQPVRGRFFLAEENARGAGRPVAVVSEGLWRRRYGAREDLVGDTMRINGRDLVVVGIAPAGFRGLPTLSDQALWLPAEVWPLLIGGPFGGALEHRGFRLFQMFGRLADGVEATAAAAELQTIAKRLEEEHPEWNRGRGVRVLGIAEGALGPDLRGPFVRAGAVGMGSVALVLLIACANVANLLVARARGRRREMALRLSLGAERSRLGRQLLVEGVLLSLLGGIAGLVVSAWLVSALWRLRPPFLQDGHLDLGLDLRAVAFTAGICLLTGVLFSLVPLLDASRSDLVGAMRGGERGASARERTFGVRHLLVAAQVALAIVLLVGAGLFLVSLDAARRIDAGFDVDGLAVLSLDAAALGTGEEATAATLESILREATSSPGVRRAALATGGPLAFGSQLRLMPEGSEESAPDGTYVSVNDVGPGYFETLGIDVVEGRPIGREDRRGGQVAVVVNETFAKRFWPGSSAIGRQIRWPASEEPWIVAGVAEDIKYGTLGEDPQPYLYRSLDQFPNPGLTLHLRGDGEPADLLAAVVPRVRRLAPDLPIIDPLPVRDVVERSLWAGRLGALLLSGFGALALVLAATGVYGVVAQAVVARRREVGIRLALGAERQRVVSLLVRQGMAPVAAGAIVGAALCAPLSRLFSGLLYGGISIAPLGMAAAIGVIALAALAACAMPALRAALLDPVTTLRAE